MPPTRTVSNADLWICLAGDQTEYAPGDTIVGYVFRRTHLVAQMSLLSIQLVGRAVSKMAITCENTSSRHRGVFNLIHPHAKQKLHQGPLQITDGDEKCWRFAITIPKYVDPADFAGGNLEESYLSLEETNNPLPSTFTLFGGERTEAFVEYFVRASLRTNDEDNVDVRAKFPVTVTNRSRFLGSRLHRQIYFYSILFPHLLPGMEETKLSRSQMVKQAMGVSSVPRLEFNLQVEVPDVIQLNDPTPIPIRLRAIMNPDITSDDIRNNPPTIKLRWISIQIIATTEVLCQGPHTTKEQHETDLDIINRIPIQGQDVYIPCTEHGSFIDIGDLADLRLDRYYNVCPEHQGTIPFSPTFVTYNIRLAHRLRWLAVFEVAGQLFRNTNIVMLTILGPSGQEMDESMSVSRGQSEADGRLSQSQEEVFVTGRTIRIE